MITPAKPNVPSAEGLPAIIADLPAPVQTSFLAAASRLLGGLAAFPAAWLRRPVQSFEDLTNARTQATQGLVTAAIDQWKNDPSVMEAAAQVFLPDAVRKLHNKAKITAHAAEELTQSDSAQAGDPDEDWLNSFIRISEDASSDRLQRLLGKIMAGEIKAPGSFSKATLRILGEISTDVANDFAEVYQSVIGDWFVRYEKYKRTPEWDKLVRVQDANLVSPIAASLHRPPSPINLWGIDQGGTTLIIKLRSTEHLEIPIANLTRVGVEIGRLLPPPDIKANLRSLVSWLPKYNVELVFMHTTGGDPEILFLAPELKAEFPHEDTDPHRLLQTLLQRSL